MSSPSRPASLTEKPLDQHDDDEPQPIALDRIASADYPHKFKLVFIMVALVASIFLVSLDMTIIATGRYSCSNHSRLMPTDSV